MIPNISRGDRMTGLVAYLAGPGRANEHTNPHVVAGSEGIMNWYADTQLSHQDALDLGATLDRPRVAHDAQMKGGHVWHCSLSLAAVEGELNDDLWADIAQSFVHTMGFDTQEGTKADMRWVAIHHGQSTNGNDHVHLAVQLIREDGTKAHDGFDYSRAQQAARSLEREFDLAQLDTERSKLSEPGYSRAEYEATARRRAEAKYEATRDTEQLGWGELSKPERGQYVAAMKQEIKAEGMPRDTLKVEVRAAVAMADTEAEFVGRLYDHGMLVKPFYKDREQTIVGGYQVAMASKYGEQPWYIAGGSLGHDLSLTRLRQQWDTSPELREQAQQAWQQAGRNVAPESAEHQRVDPQAVQDHTDKIHEHFEQLRHIPVTDRDRWAVEAHHLSGIMAAWAKNGGRLAQPLGQAARTLARSASMKHQPQVGHRRPTWMRDAALMMVQAAGKDNPHTTHLLMMRQLMQTMNDLVLVHTAAKEARHAKELRVSVERDLAQVSTHMPFLSGSLPSMSKEQVKQMRKEHRDMSAPMPGAIRTPQPSREHEGLGK